MTFSVLSGIYLPTSRFAPWLSWLFVGDDDDYPSNVDPPDKDKRLSFKCILEGISNFFNNLFSSFHSGSGYPGGSRPLWLGDGPLQPGSGNISKGYSGIPHGSGGSSGNVGEQGYSVSHYNPGGGDSPTPSAADRRKSEGALNSLVASMSDDILIENIVNYLGLSASAVENVMTVSVLSLDELIDVLIAEGKSPKMIDKLIIRDATIGGIARIGGQLIFYGQFGYNLYKMYKNPTFGNIALKFADTFFCGVATYGGWTGIGIAGIYFLGKESIIITIKSLNQGLIKPNPNMMRNYIPGLAPTPFINN